jgi:hypothetical protein
MIATLGKSLVLISSRNSIHFSPAELRFSSIKLTVLEFLFPLANHFFDG